jgi:hypothetical protein
LVALNSLKKEFYILTQIEADILMEMNKKIVNPKTFSFPFQGEYSTLDVVSNDEKEKFLLDVRRDSLCMSKCTYQNRYRKDIREPLKTLCAWICRGACRDSQAKNAGILGGILRLFAEEAWQDTRQRRAHRVFRGSHNIIEIRYWWRQAQQS